MMPFGGRVLEARGLWCSVSERGGRVWKSSVSDRERAREEVRGDEHIVGSGGGRGLGWLVVYSLGTSWTGRFFWSMFFGFIAILLSLYRTQLLVDQKIVCDSFNLFVLQCLDMSFCIFLPIIVYPLCDETIKVTNDSCFFFFF